jgi:hypothetical protein
MPLVNGEIESELDDFVVVAPGIAVLRKLTIRWAGIHGHDEDAGRDWSELSAERIITRLQLDRPVNLEMHAVYDDEHEVFRIRKLTVDGSFDDAAEINGALMRALRIQQWMQLGTVSAAIIPNGHYHPETIAAEADELERARRRGPSERILWSVAFVYKSADIRTLNAAEAVVQAFGIQKRTATNWIRRARELGMFDRMAPSVEP